MADHLGTTRHHTRAGERRAGHLLAGKNAAAHGVTFDTNALDLAPGSVFSVLGHPHPSLGDARRLLVTELAIDGDRDQAWLTSAKAVLADRPYHPPRVTPRPGVQGLQSAIVTGPQGDELFTDEHGRVQVRFLWDRGAAREEASSCWIRVSQGWSGAGFGLWTLPRVGHEVLVGFLEGNPDEPIIVGRAPNAHHPPPYALPANATKAVWRSRSTPDSCGYNEISFEDRAGAERFYERAERDKATDVLRDESLSVGGKRSHGVSGDEDRAIGGTVRECIGGALHETVKGERRDRIGAAHSVSVGGDCQEEIGGRWAVEADGAIHLFSGQAIVIEAPDITLKSGGAFLRVAGGVTTTGGYPAITSGGPGSGDGSAPAAPELPGKGGIEAVAFRSRVRLPLLGFPGLPMSAPPLGVDPEMPILCDAMCSCTGARDLPNGTRSTTGRNRQQCVADRLWAYDDRKSNQSTIKAEVPYDMDLDPPAPIMDVTNPMRPIRDRPAGSKIPDVVLVKDPTLPPVQSNIRKIIEMKFEDDKRPNKQIKDFEKIGGPGLPVETWTPETCGCGKKQKKPQEQEQEQEQEHKQKNPIDGPAPIPIPIPIPISPPHVPIPPLPPPLPIPIGPKPSGKEDTIEGLLLALLIVALVLDDAVGGEADDLGIPLLFKQMLVDLGLSF